MFLFWYANSIAPTVLFLCIPIMSPVCPYLYIYIHEYIRIYIYLYIHISISIFFCIAVFPFGKIGPYCCRLRSSSVMLMSSFCCNKRYVVWARQSDKDGGSWWPGRKLVSCNQRGPGVEGGSQL